jgi:serine phosphatase RsbU (regulator of sigma subunit)
MAALEVKQGEDNELMNEIAAWEAASDEDWMKLEDILEETAYMSRGDVLLINLPASHGREQTGQRPAVAVQMDMAGEPMLIPARQVGGDFFNYFPVRAEQAAILVGDVSGKGVAAALLMANLQATLSARLPLEADLVRLADRLDHEIGHGTSPTLYLTLFVAVVDGDSGIVRYVNAGHNPPVVLRADGAAEALPSTGRPLGLYPGGGYEEGQTRLRSGDALFLYTDGLGEAEDHRGEAFGCEKLEALLVNARARSSTGLLASVEQSLHRHRAGQEPSDDATMVLFRLGPHAA